MLSAGGSRQTESQRELLSRNVWISSFSAGAGTGGLLVYKDPPLTGLFFRKVEKLYKNQTNRWDAMLMETKRKAADRFAYYHQAGKGFCPQEFGGQLTSFVERVKEERRKQGVLFLCIGSDRSTGDSLGPLVGYKLQQGAKTPLNTQIQPVSLAGGQVRESGGLSSAPYYYTPLLDRV